MRVSAPADYETLLSRVCAGNQSSAPPPVRYYRRTQSIVVRWAVKGNRYRHALLLSTLPECSRRRAQPRL